MFNSKRFIKFINNRASTEVEIAKEELDELCYYRAEEYMNEYSTIEFSRQIDINAFKLIIQSINNLYCFMNNLLEKNNIILSLKKWSECEILLNKYIEVLINYYLDRRTNILHIEDKSFYVGANIKYNNINQIHEHFKRFNIRQFRIIKDTYTFNRKSISYNSYFITVAALILSIVSLIISLII